MVTAIQRYFERIGHVWVENPVSLISFGFRLGGSLVYSLNEIGSQLWWKFFSRLLKQTLRAFFRGIFLVLAIGIVSGMGVGLIYSELGQTTKPIFDQIVLVPLLRDILPMALAIIITARAGATIAAKFASYAVLKEKEQWIFTKDEFQKEVIPQIFATMVTSGFFFVVTCTTILIGYFTEGLFQSMNLYDLQEVVQLNELSQLLYAGFWKSIIFGMIIAYVASAFGIQASESFVSSEEETYDLHYAVWESSVTSIFICLILTVVLRKSTWAG